MLRKPSTISPLKLPALVEIVEGDLHDFAIAALHHSQSIPQPLFNDGHLFAKWQFGR